MCKDDIKQLSIRRVSSLIKVCSVEDIVEDDTPVMLLGGERYSFQTVIFTEEKAELSVKIESPIKEHIKAYVVKDVMMDYPENPGRSDEDFLTKEPGMMPDLLVPIEEQNGYIKLHNKPVSIWLDVQIPLDFPAGKYPISVYADGTYDKNYKASYCLQGSFTTEVEVVGINLPALQTGFTQWFHTDCIATVHHAEVYSEEHWKLIGRYMKMAAELGMNMILTPIFTPSMDIKEGRERVNTQLIRIEKKGGELHFDFSLLRRWIHLCREKGITYYEMVPLFTQWGLKYSPVIKAVENGREFNLFGWHIPATDPSYRIFLEKLLPELMEVLHDEEVVDYCRFHISDEPHSEHLEAYRAAYQIVRPLIGDCEIIDALSQVEYYENGLLDIPVTPLDRRLEAFLDKHIEKQWIYYCCIQDVEASNRFIAMPSYRNRIIGLQMYKYKIKGFLQWGYNFYNSQLSLYPVNPYVTTSADKGFPSGDAFSVYPGEEGPLPSLRALIFREALQDIELCLLLESHIGHEEVVKLIEEEAGMELTFYEYPRNNDFIPRVIKRIKEKLK